MESLTGIREGTARLLVPSSYNRKGPGSARGPVFYNRQMEFNRDVSIALLRAMPSLQTVLDAHAATGVRSMRIALETGRDLRIVACDTRQDAVSLMRRNILEAGVDVEVIRASALELMSSSKFDYIDIDPFGTPVPYVHAALQSVRKGGVIALTATDTAVLCGSSGTCERRYLARSFRSPFMHETGARILLGYVIRIASSLDMAAYPLLSYYADHYFRVYVRVERGSRAAEAQLHSLGYAHYNPATLERYVDTKWAGDASGPLWAGALHSADLLSSMSVDECFGSAPRFARMLALWKGEVDAPALFYRMDELSSIWKVNAPPRNTFLSELSRHSAAAGTHFSPVGIKCSLPPESMRSAFIRSGGGTLMDKREGCEA